MVAMFDGARLRHESFVPGSRIAPLTLKLITRSEDSSRRNPLYAFCLDHVRDFTRSSSIGARSKRNLFPAATPTASVHDRITPCNLVFRALPAEKDVNVRFYRDASACLGRLGPNKRCPHALRKSIISGILVEGA